MCKYLKYTFAAIIISGISLFSQELKKVKESQFLWSMGMTIPISDFAAVDATNQYSGFSKNGICMQLTFQQKIFNNIGLLANFGYCRNNIKNTRFPVYEGRANTYYLMVNVHPNHSVWEIANIGTGVFYSFKKKNISVKPQFVFGRNAVSSPYVFIYYGLQTYYYNTSSRAWYYSFGSVLTYTNKNKIFGIGVYYYSTDVKLNGITPELGNDIFMSGLQPVRQFSIQGTVGFCFNCWKQDKKDVVKY